VVFEGTQSIVDWGIRGARNGHCPEQYLAAVAALLEAYRPAVLVVQDMTPAGTQRAPRIRTLNAAIRRLAEDCSIRVHSYSRAQVRLAFAPLAAPTKEAIAASVAKTIPSFRRYLPPHRKPWMSEHARMGLFDAAALALTFIWQTTAS
jgi:hypothetical protein